MLHKAGRHPHLLFPVAGVEKLSIARYSHFHLQRHVPAVHEGEIRDWAVRRFVTKRLPGTASLKHIASPVLLQHAIHKYVQCTFIGQAEFIFEPGQVGFFILFRFRMRLCIVEANSSGVVSSNWAALSPVGVVVATLGKSCGIFVK